MAGTVVKEAAEAAAEGVEAVSSVKCCCCGLVEECTQAYIARVRERFGGGWICGLCSEAVKEERVRSQREKIITVDEALRRHTKFCQQFSSSPPPDNEDFILAVKQILFRTLDSSPTRKERFTCRPLGRSHSCFSTMQATPQSGDTHTE